MLSSNAWTCAGKVMFLEMRFELLQIIDHSFSVCGCYNIIAIQSRSLLKLKQIFSMANIVSNVKAV
jgi:hypothetical protein